MGRARLAGLRRPACRRLINTAAARGGLREEVAHSEACRKLSQQAVHALEKHGLGCIAISDDHSNLSARREQVGSGDRSERIRTYNFPQNRITDHRINLTLYKLDRFVEGELADMVNALNAHLQEKTIDKLGIGSI